MTVSRRFGVGERRFKPARGLEDDFASNDFSGKSSAGHKSPYQTTKYRFIQIHVTLNQKAHFPCFWRSLTSPFFAARKLPNETTVSRFTGVCILHWTHIFSRGCLCIFARNPTNGERSRLPRSCEVVFEVCKLNKGSTSFND